MKKARRLVPARRGERGQSLVEMALVMLLLLLVLAGIIDFGRAMYHYVVITNAAREGARYASHFPWYASGIRAATIGEAEGSGVVLTDANIIIDPEPPAGSDPGDVGVAQPGQPIRVGVEYELELFMASLVNIPLTLRSDTQMVVYGAD